MISSRTIDPQLEEYWQCFEHEVLQPAKGDMFSNSKFLSFKGKQGIHNRSHVGIAISQLADYINSRRNLSYDCFYRILDSLNQEFKKHATRITSSKENEKAMLIYIQQLQGVPPVVEWMSNNLYPIFSHAWVSESHTPLFFRRLCYHSVCHYIFSEVLETVRTMAVRTIKKRGNQNVGKSEENSLALVAPREERDDDSQLVEIRWNMMDELLSVCEPISSNVQLWEDLIIWNAQYRYRNFSEESLKKRNYMLFFASALQELTVELDVYKNASYPLITRLKEMFEHIVFKESLHRWTSLESPEIDRFLTFGVFDSLKSLYWAFTANPIAAEEGITYLKFVVKRFFSKKASKLVELWKETDFKNDEHLLLSNLESMSLADGSRKRILENVLVKNGFGTIVKLVHFHTFLGNLMTNGFEENEDIWDVIIEAVSVHFEELENIPTAFFECFFFLLNYEKTCDKELHTYVFLYQGSLGYLFKSLSTRKFFQTSISRIFADYVMTSTSQHYSMAECFLSTLKAADKSEKEVFVDQLSKILEDASKSVHTMQQFRLWEGEKKQTESSKSSPQDCEKMNINYSVLYMNSRILPEMEKNSITPPSTVLDIRKKYETYSQQMNKNKKLQWASQYDRAVVETSHYSMENSDEPIQLLVSLPQLCILMLFNDRETVSWSQILNECIDSEENKDSKSGKYGRSLLKAALKSLHGNKMPLLCKGRKNRSKKSEVVFKVNSYYVPKKSTLQVPQLKVEDEEKPMNTLEDVIWRKKDVTEGVLLKVLKKRKSLNREELWRGVQPLVDPYFPLDTALFEKTVQELVDREYIYTREENETLFCYNP